MLLLLLLVLLLPLLPLVRVLPLLPLIRYPQRKVDALQQQKSALAASMLVLVDPSHATKFKGQPFFF
jgi:hypothetical protein